MTPTLDQALRDQGLLSDVPAEVRDYLEAVHGLNGERNRKIAAQVVEITAALNAIGIEPVLLKGVAHLLADLYGDPAARVIGDIDLLVSAERIADAVGALAAIGYREAGLDDVSFAAHHHHTPLARGDDGGRGRAAHGAGPAGVLDAVRRRSGSGATRGRWWSAAIGPGCRRPQDLVVHNIVHGQLADRHYWSGRIALRPLCDLVRLRIAHDAAIDWPEVLADLRSRRLRRRLPGLADDRAAPSRPGAASRLRADASARAFACWRSAAQIRSPRLMAVGETYGYHRAMIARLCGGPIARQQVLGRLLHPRGYRRYLRSFRAHRGRLD